MINFLKKAGALFLASLPVTYALISLEEMSADWVIEPRKPNARLATIESNNTAKRCIGRNLSDSGESIVVDGAPGIFHMDADRLRTEFSVKNRGSSGNTPFTITFSKESGWEVRSNGMTYYVESPNPQDSRQQPLDSQDYSSARNVFNITTKVYDCAERVGFRGPMPLSGTNYSVRLTQ